MSQLTFQKMCAHNILFHFVTILFEDQSEIAYFLTLLWLFGIYTNFSKKKKKTHHIEYLLFVEQLFHTELRVFSFEISMF